MKTNPMKWTATMIAAVGVTIAVTGCQPTRVEEDPDAGSSETVDPGVVEERGDGQLLREEPIVLEDGRTITCVIYDSDTGSGVSCDWIGPIDR